MILQSNKLHNKRFYHSKFTNIILNAAISTIHTVTFRLVGVPQLAHLGLYGITVDTKISNFLQVLTTR